MLDTKKILLFLLLSASVFANEFWNDGCQFLDVQKLDLDKWDVYIAVTPKGTILAGNSLRSTDGGDRWQKNEKPIPMAESGAFAINEITGEVLKFDATRGCLPEPILYRSTDDGLTWIEGYFDRPKDERGWYPLNVHSSHGITLKYGKHKGRLLAAGRVIVNYDNKGRFDDHYSTAMYSDDNGKTWKASAPFPARGTGESGLVELKDGTIYYNTRTHTRFGNRLIATSSDGGQTWEDLRTCDYLPDGPPDFYGCRGGLVRLPLDDHDILIYSQNDVPSKGDKVRHTERGRANLTIWASFDGGKTWPAKRMLTTFGGYTDLAAGVKGTPSEGYIYMLGHSGYLARFNLAWITAEKDWNTFLSK